MPESGVGGSPKGNGSVICSSIVNHIWVGRADGHFLEIDSVQVRAMTRNYLVALM